MILCHWLRLIQLVVGIAMAGTSLLMAQETLNGRIGQLARPYIDAEVVVGMSIGVVTNGNETTVNVGRVSSHGKRPDADTVYEIGSVSKVFTGILLADAVVRNELRLHQAVQELVPGKVTVPVWENRPITLLDLATHSSGLPRLPNNMPSSATDNPYADYTSKLAYAFLSEHKLRRAPGKKYEYSNLGASLLGHLISEKAGQSFDQLLVDRLARPLGMNETRVAFSEAMKHRLAVPHAGFAAPTSNWDFADMPGAGGIRSSTRDMLRFAKAQIDPPDSEIGRAIQLAWKAHRNGHDKEPTMGLGWHFAPDGNTRWHNGQTGGYHAMLMVNRDAKMAVVLLANTAYQQLDELASDIRRMLSGEDVKPKEFEKSIRVSKEVMQRYVGSYELAPTFVFTVSVKDDKLMVGITNQPTVQVFPRSESEWFYKIVDATLTFKLDADGNCQALELFQNGVRQTAKRIEP